MESSQWRPNMPGAFSEESPSEGSAPLRCDLRAAFNGSPTAHDPRPDSISGQRPFDASTRLPSQTNYEAVTLADAVGWFFTHLGSLITVGGLFVLNPKSLSTAFMPLVCLRPLDYTRRKR